MVTDLVNQLAMCVTNFGDVRRVDYYFSSVGNRRLDLVHALGGGPEVVVEPGHDGEHATKRLFYIDDVYLGRKRGGSLPGLVGGPK